MNIKEIISIVFCLCVFFTTKAQNKVGQATTADLMMLKQQYWFQKNYNEYKVDTATINLINKDLISSITIVLGTWCSDSKLQVPRFFKILDALDYKRKLKVILVDKNKQANIKGYKKLEIVYVPTIIFYNKEQKQLGRIIESPKLTLEKDLLQMLQ